MGMRSVALWVAACIAVSSGCTPPSEQTHSGPTPASTPNHPFIVRRGTSGRDVVYDLARTSTGNYVAVGESGGVTQQPTPNTNSAGKGSMGTWDAFVAAYDRKGVELWAHEISSPGPDVLIAAAAVGDGSVLVAGTFSGAFSIAGTRVEGTGSVESGIVLCLDAHGSVSWYKTFSGTGPTAANHLALGPHSVLVSVMTPANTAGSASSARVVVYELDFSGNTIRSKEIAQALSWDASYTVARLGDNWVVAGEFSGVMEDGAGHLLQAKGDVNGFVIALDGQLDTVWSMPVTGPSMVSITSIDTGTDFMGAPVLYVSGHYRKQASAGLLSTRPVDTTRNGYVLTIGTDGQVHSMESITSLPVANTLSDWAIPYKVASIGPGLAVLVGEFNGEIATGRDTRIQAAAQGDRDGFVAVLERGEITAIRTVGDTARDGLFAVQPNGKANVVVAGVVVADLSRFGEHLPSLGREDVMLTSVDITDMLSSK